MLLVLHAVILRHEKHRLVAVMNKFLNLINFTEKDYPCDVLNVRLYKAPKYCSKLIIIFTDSERGVAGRSEGDSPDDLAKKGPSK